MGSKDQSYKALRRFEKRMADKTDDRCRMFWHLEFQRRGAPHWHCLMVLPLTVKGQPITKVVSQQWYEAVGSDDPKHLAAGTRIDFDESIKGTDPLRVALYFAGYSINDRRRQGQVLPVRSARRVGRLQRVGWPVVGQVRCRTRRRGSPYRRPGRRRGQATVPGPGTSTTWPSLRRGSVTGAEEGVGPQRPHTRRGRELHHPADGVTEAPEPRPSTNGRQPHTGRNSRRPPSSERHTETWCALPGLVRIDAQSH